MSDWLVSVDSVWERATAGSRIRRLSGRPTPTTRAGEWNTYLDLRAAVQVPEGTAVSDDSPRRGAEWLILRRSDGRGSTAVSPLIVTTTLPPAGIWGVNADGWVTDLSGHPIACAPRWSGAAAGVAGLLYIAELLPHQPGTDWYFSAADGRTLIRDAPDLPDAVWVVHHAETPLLLMRSRSDAVRVAELLGRLSIEWYGDIIAALISPGGWETGPAAIHLADDDLIVQRLLDGGWPLDLVDATDSRTHREWLLEARAIEAAGIPWPRVYDAWPPSDLPPSTPDERHSRDRSTD